MSPNRDAHLTGSVHGLVFLSALFSGALVLSAVLATKLVAVGPLVAPAGVLAFAITFACTDIIHEIYGKAAAQSVIGSGFVTLLLGFGLGQLAVWWPAPHFWEEQAAFEQVMQSSARIIGASVVAYLISQFTDIWLFERLRAMSAGRWLWLRNMVSTICAQLLDTTVFIVLAFSGSGFDLGTLIMGQWIIKSVLALLDTPLVYLGVWWYRRRQPATR